MAWRLARSLIQLREQINKKYPNRSKVSDGAVGDEAHATRASDHNPWIKEGDMGIVTAIDVTNDPQSGLSSRAFAVALIQSMDLRIKYIIANGQIASGSDGPAPWQWRKYSGKNPHNHHFHISVKSAKKHYDDVREWSIGAVKEPPPQEPPEEHRPVLKKGMEGDSVRELQLLLGEIVDGVFGEEVENAVKQRQREAGIIEDGIVGAHTWDIIIEGAKL